MHGVVDGIEALDDLLAVDGLDNAQLLGAADPIDAWRPESENLAEVRLLMQIKARS